VERLKTQQKSNRTRNAQKRKNKSLICDPNAPGDEEDEDFEDAEGPTEAYSECTCVRIAPPLVDVAICDHM